MRGDVATCVDMPFISCAEEEDYVSRLALIVQNCSELTDAAPLTYSLENVAFPCRYNSLYLLTNVKHWWNKIQFEQQFCVRHHVVLFLKWLWVDIFGLRTCDLEKFVVCVLLG